MPTLLSSVSSVLMGRGPPETSESSWGGSGISEQLRASTRDVAGWRTTGEDRRAAEVVEVSAEPPAPSPLRGAWNSGSRLLCLPVCQGKQEGRTAPAGTQSRGRMKASRAGQADGGPTRLGRAEPPQPHLTALLGPLTLAEAPSTGPWLRSQWGQRLRQKLWAGRQETRVLHTVWPFNCPEHHYSQGISTP